MVLYFCDMLRFGIAILFLGFNLSGFAQVRFEQKATRTGRIGLNLTNVGTIGRPDVSTNTQGNPSMEYPIGSGIEHLFEGGLWIGAQVDGQIRVSSSAIEAARGYTTGAPGFEFTQLGPITERSSLTSSSNYSNKAISHQDFTLQITDRYVQIPGTSQTISGHDFPLFTDVTLESYAWNYSFADYFVVLNYAISNRSNKKWDSVFLGFYTDMVVRNVNVTQESGTAFFNKGRNNFDTAYQAIYAWQVAGDDIDYTRSYGALQYLGTDYRGIYVHPRNNAALIQQGYPPIKVNSSYWNYGGTNPPFARPNDDLERYSRMRDGIPAAERESGTGPVKFTGNWIQLLSVGPFLQIDSGETVKFTLAFVCARQLGNLVNGQALDLPESRKELSEHLNWAKRTYLGEDLNENGKLDSLEDVNGNAKLDRFILPEPPSKPNVRVVSGNKKVTLYWNDVSENSQDPLSRQKDFEGYRLYRTNPGDDLTLNLIDQRKIAGQWDLPGNNIGYNNGFNAIRLTQPKFFDEDTIPYIYMWEDEGVLNGFQHAYILTAFDRGNDSVGLPSLESSLSENTYRVFTGSRPEEAPQFEPGVYPNPYRTSAAWDGTTSRTKKIYFYHLPARCKITIFTSAGDLVKIIHHDASQYQGSDVRWFDNFAGNERLVFSGGEHAWDILTESKTAIAQGVYLFTVENTEDGTVKHGKFAILR